MAYKTKPINVSASTEVAKTTAVAGQVTKFVEKDLSNQSYVVGLGAAATIQGTKNDHDSVYLEGKAGDYNVSLSGTYVVFTQKDAAHKLDVVKVQLATPKKGAEAVGFTVYFDDGSAEVEYQFVGKKKVASIGTQEITTKAVLVTTTLGDKTSDTYFPDPATYSVAASAASADEGSSSTFTLTTTNVAAGTHVPLTLSGLEDADFDGAKPTEFVVGADGKATVTVALKADLLTEGAQTLTLAAEGKTAAVTVNDTSLATTPTYVVAAGASSANEGSSVTFTLTTTNVAEGTHVALALTGLEDADFDGAKPAEFVVGADGKATVTVALKADLFTEGDQTLTLAAEGKSAAVTVVDSSKTPENGTPVVLDGQGTDSTAVTLSADAGEMAYSDAAATGNNVQITGFGADDSLTFSGVTAAELDGWISSDGSDVTIAYNDNGTLSQVVLVGVAGSALVYDVASFNALGVGDILFA